MPSPPRRREPLDDARRALAAEFLPYARAAARRWSAPPWRRRLREDFESAACLALVEAAADFDPARNPAFRTHLWRRLRGARSAVLQALAPLGYRTRGKRAPITLDLARVPGHPPDRGPAPPDAAIFREALARCSS